MDHQAQSDSLQLLQGLDTSRIIGLYLHIPFCFHKCHYCDFYSIVDKPDRQRAFVDRMIDEMATIGPPVSGLRTIFVGGGTPTLLQADAWSRLLAGLHESFDLDSLTEFTVEANPETVNEPLLQTLASGRVNRISIGCQSFNTDHLKTLERWHDPANIAKSMKIARSSGIENINLDLIFAIPGQTLPQWQDDLKRAVDLGVSHLSCYSLIFEPNTPLTQKMKMGRIDPCEDSLEASMFEWTIDFLTTQGLNQYEVSNFARGDKACRHNLVYWRNENFIAIGPSASGHVNGVRWKNQPHLGKYLASTGGSPIQDVEQLDTDGQIGEMMMLGLRLSEGLSLDWINQVVTDERHQAIKRQIEHGLLEQTPTSLRLTRRGLMVADSVIAELL